MPRCAGIRSELKKPEPDGEEEGESSGLASFPHV
jgi:hypothetical protein